MAEGAVVIITGPPGAGQTTAAGTVASRSAETAAHLHPGYIKAEWIPPYLAAAQRQNRIVIGVLVDDQRPGRIRTGQAASALGRVAR